MLIAFICLLTVGLVGLFFHDESFIFKSVLFLIVAIPVLWFLLVKCLQEQDNRIKELEERVYELEKRR